MPRSKKKVKQMMEDNKKTFYMIEGKIISKINYLKALFPINHVLTVNKLLITC